MSLLLCNSAHRDLRSFPTRRSSDLSFLPFGEAHLAVLAVLERGGAEFVRPHHAESAAVQQDDRRARAVAVGAFVGDRKSTRLNSSHANNSYAVFYLKTKNASPVERK